MKTISRLRNCLLIRKNICKKAITYVYESAVAITSLLKTITGPLKTIKIAKIDLKKVSRQKIIFAHLSRYNGPNFYGKNILLSQEYSMWVAG